MQTLPQLHIMRTPGCEKRIGEDEQVVKGKTKSGELAVQLGFHDEARAHARRHQAGMVDPKMFM